MGKFSNVAFPRYMQLLTYEVVEVCPKVLYQVELVRESLTAMWGFTIEAELIENSERQDELCCFVCRIEDKGMAMMRGKPLAHRLPAGEVKKTLMFLLGTGVIAGDEIMVINGAIVSDLDMMFIESVLQEEITLCMMMRSSRIGITMISAQQIVITSATSAFLG